MDWRLPAAVVAAIVLLLGAQALVSQVKPEFDQAIERGLDVKDTPFDRLEDENRFRIRDLTLPKHLDAILPEGTEINPDLSKIKLDQPLDIELPDAIDIPDFDMTIPPGTKLKIPEGSSFDGRTLKLPEGLTGRLPDGLDLNLPPGSNVNIPPELAAALGAAGLMTGLIPRDLDLTMPYVPGVQGFNVDPPTLPGGGKLRLPEGTELTLPPGTFPPFPGGALPRDTPIRLPPGTDIDLPPGSVPPGGGPIAPPGGGPSRPTPDGTKDPPGPDAERGPPLPTQTEIDAYDAKARKGEPFHVGGFVVSSPGGPVAGAPVHVFLNETKTTPGTYVGASTTDAAGRFSALVTLPADKPAGDYQLVARSGAFTTHDGRRYQESWSDPPVHVSAATRLALERVGERGLEGRLADTGGLPVAHVPVRLVAGDGDAAWALTDLDGRFAFHLPEGAPALAVAFAGTRDHEPTRADVPPARLARASASAPDAWSYAPSVNVSAETRIDARIPEFAPVNAPVKIEGRLLDHADAGVANARINLYVNSRFQGYTLTNPQGAFSFTLSFRAPAQNTIVLVFPGTNNYAASQKTADLVASSRAFDVPSLVTAEIGSRATFTGRLLEEGRGVSNAPVTLGALGGTHSGVTDTQGRFTIEVPVKKGTPLGETTATFTSAQASSASATLRVLARATLDVEVPGRWPVDELARATLLLIDPDGSPLPNVRIAGTISGPGGTRAVEATTNAQGRAEATLAAPSVAGDYTLTLAPAPASFVSASPVVAPIRFGDLRAHWEVPDPIVRGRSADVIVTLRFDGAPLPGVESVLSGPGLSTRAPTSAEGRVAFGVTLPKTVPLGATSFSLELPLYGAEFTRTVRVVAPTELALETAPNFRPGDALPVNATLLDDNGAPVPGARVRFDLAAPDWQASLTGETSGAGRATGLSPTEGAPESTLRVTAAFEGSGAYLPSSASAEVALRPASIAGFALPSAPTLAIGAGGLGGLGLLAGGVFYWRKRRPLRASAPVEVAAAAPVAPRLAPTGPQLLIEFPAIDPDLPDVWGAGEPLPVSVSAPAEARAGGLQVRLDGLPAPLELSLGNDGAALAELPPLPEGEYALAAEPPAGASLTAGRLTLRVVDYRREIAREFEAFLDAARARSPSLGKHATPREVEWTLAPALGPASERPLGEMALAMEIANYSHKRVDRATYVRFMRALAALSPVLATPAPEARPTEEARPSG